MLFSVLWIHRTESKEDKRYFSYVVFVVDLQKEKKTNIGFIFLFPFLFFFFFLTAFLMDNKMDERWPFCKVSVYLSQSLLTESFRNIITVISFLVF